MKLIRATSSLQARLVTLCTVFSMTALLAGSPVRAAIVNATFDAATDVSATASEYTATGRTISFSLQFAPATGTVLTVIQNTGLDFIHGTFSNLAQGQAVDLAFGGITYHFVANYYGGTGNDLVLLWANTMPVAWGWNGSGELGNNLAEAGPVLVAVNTSPLLAGKTIASVAAGYEFSFALCTDGTLASWGLNSNGQLGNNSSTNSHVPVAVSKAGVLAGRTVIAIAAGYEHSLALCSDGSIAAWGANDSGALGNNTTTPSLVPVAVNTDGALRGRTVVAIAAGTSHSLALCSDGTLAVWGSGVLVPVVVGNTGTLSGRSVVTIAAGGSHNLALCSDGTVVGWGFNGNGQLGTGNYQSSALPVAVSTSGVLAGKTVTSIAATSVSSFVLCSDGTVAGFGWNPGTLGDISDFNDTPFPVTVKALGALAGRHPIALTAGGQHCVALCSDGAAVSWGVNANNQLGNNSTESNSLPVLVNTAALAAGSRLISLNCGEASIHTLGIVALPLTQLRTAAAGSFAGLVETQSGFGSGFGTEGCFTATVQANRTFSSKLTINGQTLNITGVFDDQGFACFGRDKTSTFTILRLPASALVVEFKHDLLDGISGSVTQRVRNTTTGVSIINAGRIFYNGSTVTATVPSDYLGKARNDGIFNVTLPALLPYNPPNGQNLQTPGLSAADYPLGYGFAKARITRAGAVTFAGLLADSTPFTASSRLVGNASKSPITLPVFTLLYNRRGFFSASLLLDSTAADSDFSTGPGLSFARWARPALNSQYYPNGWPETIFTQLLGSKYEVKSGESILPDLASPSADGNANLTIQEGAGFSPHAWRVNIGKTGITKVNPQDRSLILSLNRTTGLLSGSFRDDNGTRPTFRGLIYRKGYSYNGGWGFSLSVPPRVKDYKGQSGMVQLLPW